MVAFFLIPIILIAALFLFAGLATVLATIFPAYGLILLGLALFFGGIGLAWFIPGIPLLKTKIKGATLELSLQSISVLAGAVILGMVFFGLTLWNMLIAFTTGLPFAAGATTYTGTGIETTNLFYTIIIIVGSVGFALAIIFLKRKKTRKKKKGR